MPEKAVVEFKSLARPFRAGDLVRLWGYGVQHHAHHAARLRPRQITLLLVVPSLTPALRRELDRLGFSMHDLGGGYRRIDGMVYLVYVALIAEDFLRSLSSATQQAVRARTKRSQRRASSTPHPSADSSASIGRSITTGRSRTPRGRSK